MWWARSRLQQGTRETSTELGNACIDWKTRVISVGPMTVVFAASTELGKTRSLHTECMNRKRGICRGQISLRLVRN